VLTVINSSTIKDGRTSRKEGFLLR